MKHAPKKATTIPKLGKDEKKSHQDMEPYEYSAEQIEQIAKILQSSGLKDFMRYIKSPWKIIVNNLLAGIFRGLGIIVGMTIVFAVVLWVLSIFVDFPLIGEYFLDLKNMLESFSNPTFHGR